MTRQADIRRLSARRLIAAAGAASALLVAAAFAWWIWGAGEGTHSGFFSCADRQAYALYRRRLYADAAARFHDPMWRAAALYRAGDFRQAAALWAGADTAEAAYNHGNALLMQGQYAQAVARYDRALALRPRWADAVINRDLARQRAAALATEGGDMTGGRLGADDVVYSAASRPAGIGGGEGAASDQPNDAALRAIWLRRVQTRPADFLRAKFAAQLAAEERGERPSP
jgi:Ca-activated chloride channel family protein